MKNKMIRFSKWTNIEIKSPSQIKSLFLVTYKLIQNLNNLNKLFK
jgi:hypothetical protein